MSEPALHGGSQDIYLGRQSILDREQNLHAFELLFRSSQTNRADVKDGVTATATVIDYALNELGLETVLGNYRGFINVDAWMLMSDMIELLPRRQIVLELLETVEPTEAVVQRCRQLRAAGFRLALDDFVSYDERFRPLIELSEIVKVDIQQLDDKALWSVATRLSGLGVRVRMLAEKVDSPEQFKRCLDLGFELFQGYYFAKPQIITGKKLSNSESLLMRLLGLLLADADSSEIEQVFKMDPGLTVNMLRLVNSVATGTGRKVTSLASALIVLGRRQLQRWLQLLLFAQLAPNSAFPSPLLQLAATRGKLLEILAAGDKEFEDRAFMTGIMSLMDTLLAMPIAEIIAPLPIAADVREALLERKGALGRLLVLAEALERRDDAELARALAAVPGLGAERVNAAQLEALGWANGIAEPA